MKNRNLRFFIVSAALVFLAVVALKNITPFGKGNTSFAVDQESEITRFELSDDDEKLSLEKDGENWLVGGKSEARKSGILFMLRILQEIRIKSPVSDDLFQSEISGQAIVPVKVKVYHNRKLLTTFLVYKTTSNKYGNIMRKSAGSKPFIVAVPGFEGDIGAAFTLNKLYWEPFTVFNLLPSEIAGVNFENFTDPSSSFKIQRRNQSYSFSGPGGEITGFDSALITRYLSYFARIPLEKWVLDLPSAEKNKLESEEPLFRITVVTSDGTSTVLTLWERMTGEGEDRKIDTDRLFGKTEKSNEFFIMRYFDIDPLIKKQSYFLPH